MEKNISIFIRNPINLEYNKENEDSEYVYTSS